MRGDEDAAVFLPSPLSLFPTRFTPELFQERRELIAANASGTRARGLRMGRVPRRGRRVHDVHLSFDVKSPPARCCAESGLIQITHHSAVPTWKCPCLRV